MIGARCQFTNATASASRFFPDSTGWQVIVRQASRSQGRAAVPESTERGHNLARGTRRRRCDPLANTLSSGVKTTYLVDLRRAAAACKAVYAGSIPTPASNSSRYSGEPIMAPRTEAWLSEKLRKTAVLIR